MPDFYTVVTDTGLQALGLASTQGQSFSLPQAVVGDGNGQSVIPNKGMTTLVNEVWRGDVAGIKVDPEDPNTFIFEFAIPAETGGFTIREVGLLDENGKLFCIGNFPDTEKPVAVNGSVRDLVVRLPLHFENAEVVNLVINAAIVLATKQDIADHNEDPQAHRLATTAQTGFVRLATVEEHKAKAVQSLSCTPFGVWELIKSLMSDACASTSTLKIATSNAVSQVFNRVEAHKTADDPHGIVAKVKALLSSSTTSTSTTTFANPKAVKTVQDNLNAHDANAQAHRMGTEGQTGFVRLATEAEHPAVVSARRDIAATPYGVWKLLYKVRSDSVVSTSTYRFATSKAVKTVMDALNGHKDTSDPHGIIARVKGLLTSSITSTSTTTFAAPKAVKTVNDNVNAHKVATDPHNAQSRINSKMNGHLGDNDPHGVVAKVKALLSSSITSTSTTTFATPKAVKLVHNLITSHIGDSGLHSSGAVGINIATFTSSGEYRKPSNLVFIEVWVVGGGGAGTSGKQRGGGGGGTAIKTYAAPELSSSESVVIGAGGRPNGGNGGTSRFKDLRGYGGEGALNGTEGSLGGTASGGDMNMKGSGGGAGSQGGPADGGKGGDSFLGGGAAASRYSYSVNGANGGGGGSYGESGGTGGYGGDGVVFVKEYLKEA